MRVFWSGAILVAWVLGANPHAQAQSKSALRACAAAENEVERLTCFDQLMLKHGLAPAVEQKRRGKWLTSKSVSPIDDSVSVVLSNASSDRIFFKHGRAKPELFVRCMERNLDVYINLDVFLGLDSVAVTTRVDRETAQTRGWLVSTDHQAIFTEDAREWLYRLADASKLVVRVTPYGESPVTFSFDVGGLKAVAEPLLASCNLPPMEPYVCVNDTNLTLKGMSIPAKPEGDCVFASRAKVPRKVDGDLVVTGPRFSDLSMLKNVEEVKGALIIKNTDIKSLAGLEALSSIGGDLVLAGNEALIDVDGLPKLTKLAGKVTETDNPWIEKSSAVRLWQRLLKLRATSGCGDFLSSEVAPLSGLVAGCGGADAEDSDAPRCETNTDCAGASFCNPATRRCVGG